MCRQCSSQTLLHTSRFCRDSPADYTVNKEFSAALDQNSFGCLVTLVQTDTSIRRLELPDKSKQHNLLARLAEEPEEPEDTLVKDILDAVNDQEDEVMLEGAVVKEELVDQDYLSAEGHFLEPTVCLTEPEEVALPMVDMATVTTNSPALAVATVEPGTMVMGGTVSPHPTHQVVAVHPSMFIRWVKLLLMPQL